MACMRHHREGEDRQYSLQQDKIIVSETFRPVDCKGVTDTGSARCIAIRTKANDLRKIIGRTGCRESFEERKIELSLGSGQTPTQRAPGPSVRSSSALLMYEIANGAVQHALFVFVPTFELVGFDAVEVAPPRVGVAAPLRM
jgi:hypothetical protein